MSNSVSITLSNSIWTDISSLAANGLVSNESNYSILIKEAASIPDPSDVDGHTVFAGPDGLYNWAGVSQIIWARATPNAPAPINVSVTTA